MVNSKQKKASSTAGARNTMLKELLEKGEFVITAEVCPPKGVEVGVFLSKAEMLKKKVTAINVTDNQSAVMRLSSWSSSLILLNNGIEPIYQLTCRDRNRLALQSDLLGAHVVGIKNVLALTGDHVIFGDHKDAKAVFDIDSIHLLSAISSLNAGHDINGNPIEGMTDFFAGGVVSFSAEPVEPELIKFEKKIDAGAKYFQTQAVFDIKTFSKYSGQAVKKGIKILAGILLLKSAGMARYLNKNVPGVKVPQELIDELEKSADPRSKGVEIAVRTINQIKPFCSGIHIMAISQEEKVLEIIEKAGL